jgi:hypothetical protein
MKTDWFSRAVRVVDADASDVDLFGLYASFKQEIADVYGWDHADDVASLIVQGLFTGARQAGELMAYVELVKMDMGKINNELNSNDGDRWHDDHHYTTAFDESERYYFPIDGNFENEWEGCTVALYSKNRMRDIAMSPDSKTGYELNGFYMGIPDNARDKDFLFSWVVSPKRNYPPEESHNATPTQHETATSAEKHNETDN